MKKILTLAWTTYQELIRAKFFFVGIIFALILVTLSYLLGNLSFEEEKRILFNLGSSGIEFVTIGLGLFAGATLVSKEIELRTCQIILTRPLSRSHFLLGKWLGLVLFIFVILFGLSILVQALGGGAFQKPAFIVIMSQIMLKAIVVMSCVFLVSLFLRPVLSALLGITIYLVGHSLSDIRFFFKKGTGEVPMAFEVFSNSFPRFDTFNWKSFYFIEKGIPEGQASLMVGHFVAWIVLCLAISLLSWRKKDIG
ncbi:MAG: ABC transporter permease [Bdellovibrionales bacterium]